MTSRAITIKPEHLQALSKYTPEEIDLVKQTVAKDCTDTELAFFLYTAYSRKLNPFARQIYAIRRKQGETTVMIIQTGIDGYRSIAARSGDYGGSDEPIYGPTISSGEMSHPEYVKTTVYKVVKGLRVPFTGVAYWDEFAQSFNGKLGDMWKKMPRNQLSKCA